jgi:hypothetical protein
MKVITIITDSNNDWFVNFMRPTVEFHGLELVVLTHEDYPNHSVKDKILYQYLKDLNPDEITFYTDGYDAIFLSNAEEILKKYYKTGKDILFSGEINCYPDSTLSEKYPACNSPFRFLNSGGFIGKAGSIIKFIEEDLKTPAIVKFSWSNQIYWTEQFLRHEDKIGVDSQCDIFATLSSSHDMSYLDDKKNGSSDFDAFVRAKKQWFKNGFYSKDKRLYVASTHGRPCHIHFNGLSRVLLEEVVITL